MANQHSHIDLTEIAFPSDGVTIKLLRQLFPQEFNTGPLRLGNFDQIELPAMLSLERRLASRAFNAVLCKEIGEPLGDWDQDRDDLAALYVRYKLAGGVHHAEQLIRGFEQAAAAKARKQSPAPPSR